MFEKEAFSLKSGAFHKMHATITKKQGNVHLPG